MKKSYSLIFHILLFFPPLFVPLIIVGQQAILRGTISSQAEGDALLGATIRVVQDSAIKGGAYSDLDGNYEVKVPAGTYQVIASFTSFRPDTVVLDLVADKVTVYSPSLLPSSIEVVVISAEGSKRSENFALEIRKLSKNTIDLMPGELIARVGANNAADALARVSGVSISEGKYAVVRGLSDRYNQTLINLGEIPPLDPDRATVQLDRFPTGLIDNITVYKNFTPDLPGSFSAGLIDIQTKTHPTQRELKFTASVGYNTVSSLKDDFLTYEGGKWDFIGLDDGTREIPATLITGNTTSETQAEAIEVSESVLRDSANIFPSLYTIQRRRSSVNQAYSLTYGNQRSLWGRPFGYVVSLNYRRNLQDYDGFEINRILYNATQDTITSDGVLSDGSGTRTEIETQAGAIVNLSYKPRSNHKLQFTYIRTQGGTDETREQIGTNEVENQNLRINNVMLFTERSLDAFQLKGKHDANLVNIDWTSTYSLSNTEQPDFRFIPYDARVEQRQIFVDSMICFPPDFTFCIDEQVLSGIAFDTTNIRSITGGSTPDFIRQYRFLDQRTLDLKLNLTFPVPVWEGTDKLLEFKIGGAYTYKDRNFNSVRYRILPGTTNSNNPVLSAEVEDPTGGFFESSANALFTAFPIQFYDLDNQPGVPYFADQTVAAGYFMSEIAPVSTLTFIGGLRYELTDMAIDGPSTSIGSDFGFRTNDFLPAFHIIYKPIPSINIRTGYSRTLARPSFRELSTFFDRSFSGDFRVAGTPFTKRSIIDNADLRIDWFPGLGEILSVGGYYKEILGPIELVLLAGDLAEFVNLRTGPETDAIDPFFPKELTDELADGEANGEPTPGNVQGDLAVALAYGLEVELRKNFGFLGEPFEKLTLGGNYALLRTEVPLDSRTQRSIGNTFSEFLDEVPTRRRLYNQPTFTVNAELAYIDPDQTGLEVSLNYNQFGDRLVLVTGNGVGVIEKSRELFNISIRKKLGENFAVRFRANNLLNPEYIRVYQILGSDIELETFENSRRGRTFSLGISYEL